MSYPYFAASLPQILFDSEPPMTGEAFRDRCREQLGRADFAALRALLDDGATTHPFVCRWRDRDTQVRNAIARHRAARLGDAGAATRWQRRHAGFDVATERAVDAAFQEADPLRRDTALSRLRWTLAGEIAGLDPFSVNAILAYAIRLHILLHRAAADAAQGLDRLRAMTTFQSTFEA